MCAAGIPPPIVWSARLPGRRRWSLSLWSAYWECSNFIIWRQITNFGGALMDWSQPRRLYVARWATSTFRHCIHFIARIQEFLCEQFILVAIKRISEIAKNERRTP